MNMMRFYSSFWLILRRWWSGRFGGVIDRKRSPRRFSRA